MAAHNEKKAFVVVLVVLGVFFLVLLRPVFVPLFLGAILAILLYPTYSFFLRVFRNRRYVASFFSTLLVFLILVLPFSLILALIVNEAFKLLSTMDIGGVAVLFTSQDLYQEYINPAVLFLEERFHLHVDLVGIASRFGGELARTLYKFSPDVLGQTASFLFGFFVMHVSLFFLFIEGGNVVRTILDLSPLKARYEEKLAGEFRNMIYATIYGYLVTALIQGILAGLGFWMAGVAAPLVFGTLCFFMSLVPIIGATSVWLPISVWLLIRGETGAGVLLIVWGVFFISMVDNIIKPWIMRGKAKIHILLIFFSLLGGITLFGPVGILFGPVITSLFLACVRIYREDFLTTQ